MLNRMPWYNDYLMIKEDCEQLENELEEIRSPLKKFDSIVGFYNSIGADYNLNSWMSKEKEHLFEKDTEEDELVEQYKIRIQIAYDMVNAVEKHDKKCIEELSKYRSDSKYGDLVNDIMFYYGIKNIETNYEGIDRAYKAIVFKYPFNNIREFIDKGSRYHLQFLESMETCLKNYTGSPDYYSIIEIVKERLFNYSLLMNQYESIEYYNEYLTEARIQIGNINAIIDSELQ